MTESLHNIVISVINECDECLYSHVSMNKLQDSEVKN